MGQVFAFCTARALANKSRFILRQVQVQNVKRILRCEIIILKIYVWNEDVVFRIFGLGVTEQPYQVHDDRGKLLATKVLKYLPPLYVISNYILHLTLNVFKQTSLLITAAEFRRKEEKRTKHRPM